MADHRDVQKFHEKFGLRYGGAPRFLDPELLAFRLKFLREELKEFEDACAEGNLVKAFDALLDLNYVSHGTADLMGLPWRAGWDEVQRANMTKVRADSLEHSLASTGRGHASDVVKPPGFVPPDEMLRLLLIEAGWTPPQDSGNLPPADSNLPGSGVHRVEERPMYKSLTDDVDRVKKGEL